MSNDELKHVGVMGMRWGMRRAQSASRATARDAASLTKHGYKKEGAAVQKVSDAQRKKAEHLNAKIKEVKSRKMKDVKGWDSWGTGKKVLVVTIGSIGMLKLADMAAGTAYILGKIAMKGALR